MNILVTGGAGYVGSIVAETLIEEAHRVIIFDSLQQGHRQAVLPEANFVIDDICDVEALDKVFHRFQIDAVMHMAAETVVKYSMTNPKKYFTSNVFGGINLLNTMLKHGVLKLIFSSSAAVYGEPRSVPIEEDHHRIPVNAYGESKLMFETIMEWYGKAYGLKYISLRYFNAAGASRHFGEDHHPETHLIPNILKTATNRGSQLAIFGTDFPTKDGSCIRDYIHVRDIARAHVMALSKLDELSKGAYNLGNGRGYSVIEVVKVARKIIGFDIPIEVVPKRAGDPAVLVASSSRAKSELGWQPEYPELESIVESAWKWMKEHPNGYER